MPRENFKKSDKTKFYIFTNGKETEINYFELLKSKKSIYDVKIIFNNTDPLGLAELAKKSVQNAYQVWIVFDIDNTFDEGNLIKAIDFAEKNNIHYAYSNKAFEVWLISHFTKCSQHLEISDYKPILTKYLLENKCKKTYDKADKEILNKYFIPNYKTAVSNAEAVYESKLKDFRRTHGDQARLKIWEWNSSTSVFILIKELQLKN